MMKIIMLLHVLSTLVMVGLIWFVQVVHYPLMGIIGNAEFSNYEQQHMELTTIVVAPPMLVEASTALLLFWCRPSVVSTGQLSAGMILLAVIWLSTAFFQVPCHETLSNGFDTHIYQRLVSTNWIRTIAWNLRGMLVLSFMWSMWKVN